MKQAVATSTELAKCRGVWLPALGTVWLERTTPLPNKALTAALPPFPLRGMNALAVGIDMGGTSVKIGVCRGPEIVHKDVPIITADFPEPEKLIDEMVRRVRILCARFRYIESIGAGVPGFVNAETGLVRELTNVPGWQEVYLAKALREKTGLPAIAENDANCMGLAEWHYGAARGLRHFIAITLGTGVGGAVFVNGELYRGSQFGAGEVGQMSIDYRGVEGPHGNTGALERYIGHRQISERAVTLYREGRKRLSEKDRKPSALAVAAKAGDKIATRIWDEFTSQLACTLCNCVWLLNPDAVVIGGGIAQAGDLIFKPLRKKMDAQLARPFRENLLVIPAHFGNEAGIIGAAALTLSKAD